MLQHIQDLIGVPFLTPDYRIIVHNYFFDRGWLVQYTKEDRTDIDRYIYHRPQMYIAPIGNFDTMYFSQKELP